MTQVAFSLSGVEFSYPDGLQALRGVDLTVCHGESVGLVGANGAGKSTILHHLVGVHQATRGEVRVCGLPMSRQNLVQVRREVGLVFQDPNDQLFMPTVGDDVAFGPSHQGLPPEEVARRVQAALAHVGAEGLAERRPHCLSGGERRAAAIASVLALEPSCLLLDEPSASLDPATRRKLMGWLRAFPHTRLVASHDLDLVLDCCDRVVVLHDGRVLADGAARAILTDRDLLARAGLELPLRLQAPPDGWTR